ncbi:MAG: CYTH domain-containing protein [Bariatricus sp.]
MEIERKYLVKNLPDDYERYPHRALEQGYLCTEPVVRVRRDGDEYILTYKSKGFMVREEYNLPLTGESYLHLISKADGRIISKERYCIPYNDALTIELDVFKGDLAPLVLAEVEFPDEASANAFVPPDWFGEDVTFRKEYHNSSLSRQDPSPFV